MNFVTEKVRAWIGGIIMAVTLPLSVQALETLRVRMLKEYAKDFGLVPAQETWVTVDPAVVRIGQQFFESTLLSSESDTACASCHLDRFGSSDGLPTAIGVEGQSFGIERVQKGGDVLPRNTLPLWGRGGKGFETFFWDGKVARLPSGELHSQFGDKPPSDRPLAVAAHLPPLELGEMVLDKDGSASIYEQEDVDVAIRYTENIMARLRTQSRLLETLSEVTDTPVDDLKFSDVGEALADFISSNFRVKPTYFHNFVFEGGPLTDAELRGGLIFYGKGQCAFCHNGPYFTDFKFHTIPFPQFNYGANGFATDYGRFNVTQNPDDLFAFRTPPLLNVIKTAPYSHSGAVTTLDDAIKFHNNPLLYVANGTIRRDDLNQYARRVALWGQEYPLTPQLNQQDIDDLSAFLGTLSYTSDVTVQEID